MLDIFFSVEYFTAKFQLAMHSSPFQDFLGGLTIFKKFTATFNDLSETILKRIVAGEVAGSKPDSLKSQTDAVTLTVSTQVCPGHST
jgi:hypothetical protein